MIEIENGKRSNLPPAEKTELIAAIPAPIIIPDFMAEGIEKTTSFKYEPSKKVFDRLIRGVKN